jgi:adenylate cyclase
MAEERVRRRLAAILAADVVGYSRLMGADEAGTRARFNAHLRDLIQPIIAGLDGRIVKTTGDGLLVEFASVVDAVQCAVEIQKGMVERNADEPDDRRIEFRIGVNLGDVIIEGDDFHGDGVNVAARLEGLCAPGEVYISGSVFDQVVGKTDAAFDDLGEQKVKNIPKPVRVYRVRGETDEEATYGDVSAVASLPDKPSIAVLPFDNLSGDPGQDFIGDGLTEDIITGLSRFRQFFVIARNSTFQYKGASPDLRRVAKDLGVRYVVEGSVRQARDRVRITVQLIDGLTGNNLWAERYEREFDDLFAVQDEITLTIVAQLEPELQRVEYDRIRAEPPVNLDAWELYHSGMLHIFRRTKEDILEGRELFEKAIERDPSFAGAYAGIAWTYSQDAYMRSTGLPPRSGLKAILRPSTPSSRPTT